MHTVKVIWALLQLDCILTQHPHDALNHHTHIGWDSVICKVISKLYYQFNLFPNNLSASQNSGKHEKTWPSIGLQPTFGNATRNRWNGNREKNPVFTSRPFFLFLSWNKLWIQKQKHNRLTSSYQHFFGWYQILNTKTGGRGNGERKKWSSAPFWKMPTQ